MISWISSLSQSVVLLSIALLAARENRRFGVGGESLATKSSERGPPFNVEDDTSKAVDLLSAFSCVHE